MNNLNTYIIDQLIIISNTYQSISAYFYQHIIQNKFNNNLLTVYPIDYTLLLPSSEYLANLSAGQVSTQIQAYINLCNTLITYINNNTNLQSILIYEQIQNTLNISITQLNIFATGLLDASYEAVFVYNVPYRMSMTNALFLNNINIDSYKLQVELNPTILDFNNILQNTQLKLSRS